MLAGDGLVLWRLRLYIIMVGTFFFCLRKIMYMMKPVARKKRRQWIYYMQLLDVMKVG
jgi:hypothetical protein